MTAFCRYSNYRDIYKNCKRDCGIVSCDSDVFYFTLRCLFCSEQFSEFHYFVRHIQSEHPDEEEDEENDSSFEEKKKLNKKIKDEEPPQPASAAVTAVVVTKTEETKPDVVLKVKQELPDEVESTTPQHNNVDDDLPFFHEGDLPDLFIKPETKDDGSMDSEEPSHPKIDDEMRYAFKMETGGGGSSMNSFNGSGDDDDNDDDDDFSYLNNDEGNYDNMVEQSLLQDVNQHPEDIDSNSASSRGGEVAMHIKDRKMIQFVINQYRNHPFLWDHLHPRFRDRRKRQIFVDWMIMEFKRRFNMTLARDAITRKWDNLRTVYKRECNRMSMEKTNISTLWYFKELSFLNRLYPNNEKIKNTVVQEVAAGKRRLTALWNDVSTTKLLTMLRRFPSLYDKSSPGYRSKEKRGDALNAIATELQKIIDVTAIQISKRISQLRFDYSRQKQERLQCELNNISFAPTYSYYEQMSFMDEDIAPFRCDFCPVILQTSRDLEAHSVLHQGPNLKSFRCPVCRACFPDIDQYNRHKLEAHAGSISSPPSTPKMHPASTNMTASASSIKDQRYHCDLCTASFREKNNYDEHIRRHNDELLLPGLADVDFSDLSKNMGHHQNSGEAAGQQRDCICDICGKSFHNNNLLITHRAMHSSERTFVCEYPDCGRAFPAHRDLVEHSQQVHFVRKYKCEVCQKFFKSAKNLHNHKSLHDNVKRFACKVCGLRFAQPAGLYLHKRKYNHDYRPSTTTNNSTTMPNPSSSNSNINDTMGRATSSLDIGSNFDMNSMPYAENHYNSDDFNY